MVSIAAVRHFVLLAGTAAIVVVAAAPVAASDGDSSSSGRSGDGGDDCDLAGSWVHLPTSAFDHLTTPIWMNQVCVYQWAHQPGASSAAAVVTAAGRRLLHVDAPLACWLGELQSGAAVAVENSSVTFFRKPTTTWVMAAGTVDGSCQRIDMADGSLYIRSESGKHPFYMSAHEWLRVAASWLVRAAHITFEDGSRHLTPGYPTNYDGQWMRDGFYGISMLWPVANATHRADFASSVDWMLSHARADGVMPQACPPSGLCQYGQAGTPPVNGRYYRSCNGTEGAPGWRHCQDLDSGSFAVKLAHHIWTHLRSPAQAKSFYSRWAAPLERGMNATTHDPGGSGLLWSNASSPNVGYVRMLCCCLYDLTLCRLHYIVSVSYCYARCRAGV
eukprot:COSAG01_NODE_36_length_34092_cov_26.350032_14_plen_388_part_00